MEHTPRFIARWTYANGLLLAPVDTNLTLGWNNSVRDAAAIVQAAKAAIEPKSTRGQKSVTIPENHGNVFY